MVDILKDPCYVRYIDNKEFRMKATTVNLLNTEFLGAKDGDTYYLAVSNVEKALGLRSRSLREILESKKFKAMIEGASSLYTYGEKSFTYKNRKYSAIPVRTFVQLISFEAKVHRSELAIDMQVRLMKKP